MSWALINGRGTTTITRLGQLNILFHHLLISNSALIPIKPVNGGLAKINTYLATRSCKRSIDLKQRIVHTRVGTNHSSSHTNLYIPTLLVFVLVH